MTSGLCPMLKISRHDCRNRLSTGHRTTGSRALQRCSSQRRSRSKARNLKGAFSRSKTYVEGASPCAIIQVQACSVPSCRATSLGSSDLQRTLPICTGIAKCFECMWFTTHQAPLHPLSQHLLSLATSLHLVLHGRAQRPRSESVLCAGFATVTLHVTATLARCDGRDELRHSVPPRERQSHFSSTTWTLANNPVLLASYEAVIALEHGLLQCGSSNLD